MSSQINNIQSTNQEKISPLDLGEIQARSDAYRLLGMLMGLKDGLKFWKVDSVTDDMIDSLRGSVERMEAAARKVCEHLAKDAE